MSGRPKSARAFGATSPSRARTEYRAGEFGFDGRSREHRISLGADYSRALSTSRRATFRGNLTPSTLELPPLNHGDRQVGTSISAAGRRRQSTTSSSATWRASATARREVQYLIVLNEPVYSDTARLTLEGLVSRRIDVSATAAYAAGASVINETSQLDTYTGSARARFALTRSFALYTEYLYFITTLSQYRQTASDLPSLFEQHGIRVGLTLWGSAF